MDRVELVVSTSLTNSVRFIVYFVEFADRYKKNEIPSILSPPHCRAFVLPKIVLPQNRLPIARTVSVPHCCDATSPPLTLS